MKINNPTTEHAALGDVGTDQHHAQAHRATHETGGNDKIGVAAIDLNNDIALQAKESGGTLRPVVYVNTSNEARLGHTSLTMLVGHSGTLDEGGPSDRHAIWSNRWHRLEEKTADETVTSSVTLQADDHLVLATLANEDWIIRGAIQITTPSTVGLDFAFTVPTGGAIVGSYRHCVGTTFSASGYQVDLTTEVSNLADGDSELIIEAKYIGGGNAGNVVFTWAQNVSDGGATIVREESYLECHRVV